MNFAIPSAIQVSVDNSNWYKLSEHNRSPISLGYEVIEQSQRMASGTMRKYVIAKKLKVSSDWKDIPTLDSNLVDAGTNVVGGAWMKAFYEANLFTPIYVKLIYAQDTTPAASLPPSSSTYVDSRSTTGQIINAYMTSFTYDVSKRRVGSFGSSSGYDYVNVKIEFTEI
jgi:hypothetical protein